jgi:hypothetical protein
MTTSEKTFRIKRRTSFIKSFRIIETQNCYVFMNPNNIHIELDKESGSFVNGNLFDCEDLQPLFKDLFSIAKSKN